MSKSRVSISSQSMFLGVLVCLLAFVPEVASAALIYSDNFEPPTDATFTDGTSGAGAPVGWIYTGSTLFGIQNPDSTNTYSGTSTGPGTITNMNGPQVVYVYADNLGNSSAPHSSLFTHTLTGNTLTLGNVYTATIAVGHRGPQNVANVSLGYFFELWAGATLIASSSDNGSGLAGNAFTLVTLTHTAIGSDPIGSTLQLRFGTGPQTFGTNPPAMLRATDFDAVTLTETVPEPASLSLVSLGAIAALRRRRA